MTNEPTDTDDLRRIEVRYKAALMKKHIRNVVDTHVRDDNALVVDYESKAIGLLLDGPKMWADADAGTFPEYWRELGFTMDGLFVCDEDDKRDLDKGMQLTLKLTNPTLRGNQ